MNSVRPELEAAYRRTFGRIRHRGGGKERESAESAALASITHKPSEREVERYRTHGIANIHLDVHFANVEFVIDLAPLSKVRKPLSAWLSNQNPSELRLTISDGKKQTPKKNAETFDKKRNLEGIRIALFTKSRTQLLAPYEASLMPLYLTD